MVKKVQDSQRKRPIAKIIIYYFLSSPNVFFLFLIPYLGIILRTPGFDLEPAQISENVPSPVLAKSPTGIDQIANQYWPNRQPVLAKLPSGIG